MKYLRVSMLPLVVVLSLNVAAAAAEPEPLDSLLDRTGRSVEQLFRQFTSVTCTERVSQEKLSDKEKVLYRQQSNFDYMIFMDFHGNELSVEESRLEKELREKPGKTKSLPLLVTRGFSTLALVFHPFYQGSFEFQRMEDVEVNGSRSARVRFRHLPGTRSTAVLRHNGADYPLDLQGTAWIDLESGEIREITATLAASMADLNLRSFNSAVKYQPVHFPSLPEQYWLPSEASVYVETPHQRWHNMHQFTDYKLFSVNTESKISPTN